MRVLLAILLVLSLAYAEYASTTLIASQDHPQDLNPLAITSVAGTQDTPNDLNPTGQTQNTGTQDTASDLNPTAHPTLYDTELSVVSIDMNVDYTKYQLEYRVNTNVTNPTGVYVLLIDDQGSTVYTSTSLSGSAPIPSQEFTLVVIYAGIHISPLLFILATNNSSTLILKARASGTYQVIPLLGAYSPFQITLTAGEVKSIAALPGIIGIKVIP